MRADIAEQYEFYAGYTEAMQWANAYWEGDAEGSGVMPDDWEVSQEAADEMWADCIAFLTPQVVRLIDGAMRRGERYQTYGLAGAGHDFALTRNGHGAGFWDRGFGIVGDALTTIAKAEGSSDIMVGLDNVGELS